MLLRNNSLKMKALLFSIGFQPLEAASQLWLYEARLMPTGGKAPAIVDELSVMDSPLRNVCKPEILDN